MDERHYFWLMMANISLMKVITIIMCVLFLTTPSCSVNTWDVDRYKSKFQANKTDFDTLVHLLKGPSLRVGYSINENELPESIQTILHDLEISAVSLNTTVCEGVIDYQFISSWSSKATLYFSKDSCDKEQTVKGYYSKKSEMIEVWGLGDGWTMWIDHDFI